MTWIPRWPALLTVLLVSCGPLDDDDIADPSCIDGYEPLAVLDGFEGDVASIAVHPGSETLAVLTKSKLVLYDASDPRSPIEMETFQPEVLGSEASWTDIAQADWGYAVLGQTTEGGTTWAQTMKLEVGPTPSLGPSSPFELGPASGSYTGARAIAADGDVVSVLTSVDLHDGYVEYYRSDGSALSHYAWADYTGNRISPGRIVLDGERTFMCGGDRIEFAQPGEPHRHVEIDGGYSERPLRLSSGQWFVPTTSTTTTTPLYLFDAEELTVEQVGETTTGAYLDPGGAFHAALYDGELFLAQITRGLVRTPWTPPDIYAYGPGGSATSALWTRGLGTPGPVGLTRIERIDDVLLGLGPQGEGFGDAPPIGLLRICPQ